MTDQDKRRAIRRAIEVMEAWNKRAPYAYDWTLPEDIEVLRNMLADVRQLPLPLEKRARA
jgi:hypothetical protein